MEKGKLRWSELQMGVKFVGEVGSDWYDLMLVLR